MPRTNRNTMVQPLNPKHPQGQSFRQFGGDSPQRINIPRFYTGGALLSIGNHWTFLWFENAMLGSRRKSVKR